MTKYPLSWPAGWKRTAPGKRQPAKFNKKVWHAYSPPNTGGYYRSSEVTVAEGTKRVLAELERMGVREDDILISTNLELRLDGLPRSNQKEPNDPGVAVYWKKGKDTQHKVMAVDQYTKIADNLAAIAATLEAMRAIERHGGAVIMERAFTGFDALPSPNDWRHVFGYKSEDSVTLEQVRDRYRELSKSRHPDSGGSHDAMAQLNSAWEQAQEELRG